MTVTVLVLPLINGPVFYFTQAVRSFSKAVMLNPVEREVWEEDLQWACSVRDRMKSLNCGKCSNCGTASSSATSKPSSASVTVVSHDTGNASSDSEEASTSTSSLSVALRTPGAEDESVPRDSSDRQTVLKVPPNYVYLRQ